MIMNLAKNMYYYLSAFDPHLNQLHIQLRWEPPLIHSQFSFELSAFIAGPRYVVRSQYDRISKYQPQSLCKQVQYIGQYYDEADDKMVSTVQVNLADLSMEIMEINLVAIIDNQLKDQRFLDDLSTEMLLLNAVTQKPLARFSVRPHDAQDFQHENGLLLLSVERYFNDWKAKIPQKLYPQAENSFKRSFGMP
jgi:stress response protein SCP2